MKNIPVQDHFTSESTFFSKKWLFFHTWEPRSLFTSKIDKQRCCSLYQKNQNRRVSNPKRRQIFPATYSKNQDTRRRQFCSHPSNNEFEFADCQPHNSEKTQNFGLQTNVWIQSREGQRFCNSSFSPNSYFSKKCERANSLST